MESPFDLNLPLNDPWEVFEQSVFLPPWEMEIAPDQQMFENLELSIEQPIMPEQDMYADGICHTMDSFEEASMENRQSAQQFFLPDRMLDKLEADIESQVIPQEASNFETLPEPVPEKFGSLGNEPPLPDYREHPIREYPLPPGLAKGSMGTGCRSLDSGGTSMGWCRLHSKLVSFVDCEECDDDTGSPECEYWSDE